jgi:plasmid stabilization system protein ParE
MRKKYSLVIKEEAVAEIEDSYYYYEEQLPGLGELFKKFLDKTFNSIRKNPHGFNEISQNRRQAVIKKFPFVIIYEIFENTIVVFAVFHTSRNPEQKMR